jgi:hypothetical protein
VSSKLTFLGVLFVSFSVFSQSSNPALQALFQQRLQLRQNISLDQAENVKRKLMEIRGEEELVGEKMMGNLRKPIGQKSPTAFADSQGILLNPLYPKVDFRSGDVLVMRGMSILSTTIATMTDSPSLFSHTLIIYLNPIDGLFYGIEALIDQGVVINPLQKILSEGVARIVLYRQPDAALGEAAGKIAYDMAKGAIDSGKNYPYDLKLNLADNSAVYCSEWVRMAYELASDGKLILPQFISTIGKSFPKTEAALGFPPIVAPIYAPSDIDSDNRFSLVAEWRDFRGTLELRIKDQILTKLFIWIENGAVEFDYANMIKTAKSLSSKTQTGQEGAKNEIDPAKFKLLADKADAVVNQLAEKILIQNDLYLKKTGFNLSNKQIQDLVEAMGKQFPIRKILENAGFKAKTRVSCESVTKTTKSS